MIWEKISKLGISGKYQYPHIKCVNDQRSTQKRKSGRKLADIQSVDIFILRYNLGHGLTFANDTGQNKVSLGKS